MARMPGPSDRQSPPDGTVQPVVRLPSARLQAPRRRTQRGQHSSNEYAVVSTDPRVPQQDQRQKHWKSPACSCSHRCQFLYRTTTEACETPYTTRTAALLVISTALKLPHRAQRLRIRSSCQHSTPYKMRAHAANHSPSLTNTSIMDCGVNWLLHKHKQTNLPRDAVVGLHLVLSR
jgi:hypothetical protein